MSLPFASLSEPITASPDGHTTVEPKGIGARVIPFVRRAEAAPTGAGFFARARTVATDICWRTGFLGSPLADLDPTDAADRATLDRYAIRYIRDELGESWVVRLSRLPGGEALCRQGRLARDDEHTYHRFFEAPEDYHPLPF